MDSPVKLAAASRTKSANVAILSSAAGPLRTDVNDSGSDSERSLQKLSSILAFKALISRSFSSSWNFRYSTPSLTSDCNFSVLSF